MRKRHDWKTSGPRERSGPLDLASFEEQIRPHLPALKATARRILGDDDAASDAVQEALIALWQSGGVPEHLRPWLLRTVLHRSLHARRSRQRRAFWEGRGGAAVLPCAMCDPEREVEIGDLIDALDDALGALSPDHRAVMVLRNVEGLDYREISDRLNVPIGTVRSRLNRAREHIRAYAALGGLGRA